MKNLVLLLVLLTFGCYESFAGRAVNVKQRADQAPLPKLEDHIINLDQYGNLLKINGDLFSSASDEDAYLNNILTNGYDSKKYPNGILIFIHGGLNGKGTGEDRFASDARPMIDDGYYPIFIVWPSGIFSTYGYHLLRFHPPERSPVVGAIFSPLSLIADVGRAVFRSPIVNINLIRNDWQDTVVADWFGQSRVRSMLSQHRSLVLDGATNRVRLETDVRSRGELMGYGALYGVTLPGKLITAPFIDAFGKSAWHEMNARLDRISSRPKSEKLASKSSAVLPRFFDKLQTDGHSKRVTLVGHSMGAILINKILPDFEGKLKRVIFLAAACSIDEFERGTLRYLERNPDVPFFQMTLHPVAESREVVWMTVDLAPRGSLLVWIDSFLDQANSAGQRRMGRWQNFYKIDAKTPRVDNSVPFLARMGVPPLNSQTWVRGFGAGHGEVPYALSPWNSIATTNTPSVMHVYPQTHHEMGAFETYRYWSDDFLLNQHRAVGHR